MTPYDRTYLSRNRTAATFPFPELRACIDYTICEFAGELRDAMLRSERGGDRRNNDKAHNQQAELGDAFYMLLSACIRAEHEPVLMPVVSTYSLRRECNEITRYLTHAADHAEQNETGHGAWYDAVDMLHRHLDHAYSYMVHLCTVVYGWPVDGVVNAACVKFERKWAPQSLEEEAR